jgi:hypothetical protein
MFGSSPASSDQGVARATAGEPTHLYSAAAPLPPEGCASCTHPRKADNAKWCVGCKTNDPWGRAVYTMVVPLRQATNGT